MPDDDLTQVTRRTAPVIRFIEARLREDTMATRVIHRGEESWRADRRAVTIAGHSESPRIADADTDQLADYIARFDPQRIAAEIAVKRAVLTAFDGMSTAAGRNDGPLAQLALSQLHTAEMAVRIVARAYVDHPDFDPAWRGWAD